MAKRLALLIGNGQFEHTKLSALSKTTEDVYALAEVLRDKAIGNFDRVQSYIDLDEAELRKKIEHFFDEADYDDLLVFYYSGHGVKDRKSRFYLAAKNTELERLKSSAIGSNFIKMSMEDSRARSQVIILDCCHSGAFGKGAKGTHVGVEELFTKPDAGTVILASSNVLQFSWEDDENSIDQKPNSLFTHYLLQGLTGRADIDRTGRISVNHLFEYVRTMITQNHPGLQNPEQWSYGVKGDIILAASSIKREPATLPLGLTEALQNPIPAIRIGAIDLLKTFAIGTDQNLAELAISRLKKLTEDDSRSVEDKANEILSELAQKLKQQQSQPGSEATSSEDSVEPHTRHTALSENAHKERSFQKEKPIKQSKILKKSTFNFNRIRIAKLQQSKNTVTKNQNQPSAHGMVASAITLVIAFFMSVFFYHDTRNQALENRLESIYTFTQKALTKQVESAVKHHDLLDDKSNIDKLTKQFQSSSYVITSLKIFPSDKQNKNLLPSTLLNHQVSLRSKDVFYTLRDPLRPPWHYAYVAVNSKFFLDAGFFHSPGFKKSLKQKTIHFFSDFLYDNSMMFIEEWTLLGDINPLVDNLSILSEGKPFFIAELNIYSTEHKAIIETSKLNPKTTKFRDRLRPINIHQKLDPTKPKHTNMHSSWSYFHFRHLEGDLWLRIVFRFRE